MGGVMTVLVFVMMMPRPMIVSLTRPVFRFMFVRRDADFYVPTAETAAAFVAHKFNPIQPRRCPIRGPGAGRRSDCGTGDTR